MLYFTFKTALCLYSGKLCFLKKQHLKFLHDIYVYIYINCCVSSFLKVLSCPMLLLNINSSFTCHLLVINPYCNLNNNRINSKGQN